MTAKTSQHLADALRAAGFEDLAKLAEADAFHDYLSADALPDLALDRALIDIIKDEKRSQQQRTAAHHIRMRHHDGEFDASNEESDAWAASAEGQAVFAELIKDTKGSSE